MGANLCRIVAVFAVAASAFVAPPPAQATTIGKPPAEAAPGLSPRAEALRLALAAPDAASDEAQVHFESAGYEGIWLRPEGDDRRAVALLAALAEAEDHALPADRYKLPALRAAVAAATAGDPRAVAAAEVRLTRAFLAYARDLSSGLLEPGAVDRELHIRPVRPDDAILLIGAAAAIDMGAYLDGLAPKEPRYKALLGELAALRALPSDAWGAPVPEGPSLRVGDRSPRVAAMRARLVALGDHVEPLAAAPSVSTADSTVATGQGASPARPAAFDVYDVALEDSLRAFQRRHGLNDDGVAGRRTFAALNATIEDRIGQVEVSLERLRWLNRDLGRRHVIVNQADFTVRLIEDGRTLFFERVVIGKARKHRTPEFNDSMTHMIFNPIWHVPYSIASEEILPELQEDPEYLLKKNMRLVARGGGEAPDPTMTDWSLYSANDFPYLIKQGSGNGNALGRVKFMFPNQFAIYLHDTPSKRLFEKDSRAFSHGCVRVRDPMAFARALLAPQVDNPAAFVEAMLAKSGERRVNLKTPVPVYMTYLTAWTDETGVRQFREDVYGRDARILAALRAAGVRAAVSDG